jgi:hypothetical protein
LEGGQASAISTAVATLTAAISGNSGNAAGGNGAGNSGAGNSGAGNNGTGSSHWGNESSPGDTAGTGFPDHGSNFGHHHQFEHMWH